MTEVLTPDICVIGAGSGGLSVAAAAASFGVSVVLIEKGKMGGDCLNYGCVPSKALLAAGKSAQNMRDASRFGVTTKEVIINHKKVHEHIHGVIAAIAPNDSVERFTGLGVEVIEDEGYFKDEDTVVAGKREIRARRFVVATGSSAFVPTINGLDKIPYFTNETIFDNARKISHLIIIGGGPIGMEMAQAHRRLGSEVTVIEGQKALGKDDPELTAVVLEKLKDEGIRIFEGASVSSVSERGKSSIKVDYEQDGSANSVEGSHILVATGRAANVQGLGLENAGIEYDKKGIKVNAALRTTNNKVYAIGDVAGGPQFTHVAGYHASKVVQTLLFRWPGKPDNRLVPWVTYTDPELGHVGMTEEMAREKHGDNIQVVRWPYEENDRAQAERKTSGMIKMIAAKNGRILGVSIVGLNAGEMINTWSLAISRKMKLRHVTGYLSPYPTLTEIGKRAAVTSIAPFARNEWVRWIIGLLQKLG